MRIVHSTQGIIQTDNSIYLNQLDIAFKDVFTVNEPKLDKIEKTIDELCKKYIKALSIIRRYPTVNSSSYKRIVGILKDMRLATSYPYDNKKRVNHRYRQIITQNNIDMGFDS